MFLKTLRAHPFWAGLLAFALYVVIFLVADQLTLPKLVSALGNNAAGLPAPEGLLDTINQLPFEAAIALVLCLIVAALSWWRAVGFRPALPGGLKFFLIPVVFFTGFFALQVASDISDGGREVFMWGVLPASLAFVFSNLFVGFTEELMFRGILFEALRTRLRPVMTVLITAVLFSSMHLVNLFQGATLQGDLEQVIHAFGFGVMMGALRLRVVSIVPLMLYHALWDIVQSELQSAQQSVPTATTAAPAAVEAATGFTLTPNLVLFTVVPLIYGAFVLWRYYRAVKAGKISEQPALAPEQTAGVSAA